MTLPQPARTRLLPRSPYRLRRRGREQAGGCQLLRFAACLTRPDGTSARVLRGFGPVETTHPQTAKSSTRTPVREALTIPNPLRVASALWMRRDLPYPAPARAYAIRTLSSARRESMTMHEPSSRELVEQCWTPQYPAQARWTPGNDRSTAWRNTSGVSGGRVGHRPARALCRDVTGARRCRAAGRGVACRAPGRARLWRGPYWSGTAAAGRPSGLWPRHGP